MLQRASGREQVCDCVRPTAIKPLGPASPLPCCCAAQLVRNDNAHRHYNPQRPAPPLASPPQRPSTPAQNSAITATTTQVTTCLWMLSSPSRTARPKILRPTVGEPSVEAASFLSNRTLVASSSRLGTYPISSPSLPPANPLALQPGPLACRLVRSSNWAVPPRLAHSCRTASSVRNAEIVSTYVAHALIIFRLALTHSDRFLQADTNLLLLSDGSPVCGSCSYNCSVCKLPILDEAIMTGGYSCASPFPCRSRYTFHRRRIVPCRMLYLPFLFQKDRGACLRKD